jgi:ketosteroid isomerase-like protein
MPTQSIIQARSPEAVHEAFENLLNNNDLDQIMSLYEPGAALMDRDGKVISGVNAIGEYFRGLLSIRPTIRIKRLKKIDTGHVAVLISEWHMQGTGPDGSSLTDGGHTYDIVRQQSNGVWKIVVDNPWGIVIPPSN